MPLFADEGTLDGGDEALGEEPDRRHVGDEAPEMMPPARDGGYEGSGAGSATRRKGRAPARAP
jgi:hypothetical protein